jgi:hypothetical protein
MAESFNAPLNPLMGAGRRWMRSSWCGIAAEFRHRLTSVKYAS